MPTLSEICRNHVQESNSWYCSVSALEFAAKFYGLLPLDSFPLQSRPENERLGFDDTSLQNEMGLQGEDLGLLPQLALERIETETNQDKVVAIALLLFPKDPSQPPAYHIHLAAKEEGQLVLVDPANGQEICPARLDLATLLHANSRDNKERKEIHLLILSPKN